jgi:NAD(P)-dependent dehydrogenase (short-subunit alcohol dehydrogenase family)
VNMRLQDKIAVVTGGGRGIGRATARLFAREGAQVAIAELDEALAREAAEEIGGRAISIPTDVRDSAAVAALFAEVKQRFGRLDALVCNAGRPYSLDSRTATEKDWDECLNLNLRSAWLCARESFPLMQGGGSIITIASTQGYRSNRTSFPYSAAKGGLLALTRNLAVEYAPDRIRVNAVIPGQIESVRTGPFFASFTDPEEARRRVLASFPLGRLGKPEDIAKAALFLASDDAEWITGVWLTVDGGRDAALVDLSDLKEIDPGRHTKEHEEG